MSELILSARKLSKTFAGRFTWLGTPLQPIQALTAVDLDVYGAETVGLVGESGCGKTTAGRTLLRLYEPSAGTILYRGQDITHVDERKLRMVRPKLQMVFQDPLASLNPRMTIAETISEPLDIHHLTRGRLQRQNRVAELLQQVGLPATYANRYPHEFSGGQRQRVGLARALAAGPELIVCDEPVSALDVSIRAQMIELLQELQRRYQLSYLFISHDLAIVRYICHRVLVMYLGHVVEQAPTRELFASPAHPYTQALLACVPTPDPRYARTHVRTILQGELPDASHPPAGCCFCTRCPQAQDICREQRPPMRALNDQHGVCCHFA